jgi:hypothetical protein
MLRANIIYTEKRRRWPEASFVSRTNLQVMWKQPCPFSILAPQPGQALVLAMIYSCVCTNFGSPYSHELSNSGHVIPECHGRWCVKHIRKPHSLHWIAASDMSTSSCTWPFSHVGDRHQRKLGSEERARRRRIFSYLRCLLGQIFIGI